MGDVFIVSTLSLSPPMGHPSPMLQTQCLKKLIYPSLSIILHVKEFKVKRGANLQVVCKQRSFKCATFL